MATGPCKASSDLAISKFHKTVAQGPIYVCSCCDQLWYRHSVISTAKLRDSNHDSIKYLSGKTSVNNVEWICKTCHSHLIKNKIPPCAVVNGMVFPEKPSFFDLNELECRLLYGKQTCDELGLPSPKKSLIIDKKSLIIGQATVS